MIVLSNGNNIAPVPIESRLKRELTFLSNVMVVGDGQRYLCCLVTLKVRLLMHACVVKCIGKLLGVVLLHGCIYVIHMHALCCTCSQKFRTCTT